MDESNYSKWETLDLINKRIKSFRDGYRQNLVILDNDNDRINHLIDNHLATDKGNGIVTINIDTNYAGAEEMFKNISYALLSEYLNLEFNLDTLINLASSLIPVTTMYIKETLKDRQSVPFILSLELINKFIKETSRRCIFIIKEFTRLKEIFTQISPDFPQFIMFQKNCMLILTSSRREEAERVLAEELNLLFGNFEKIYLNKSNILESYYALKSSLKPINPSSFMLSFLVSILGTNRMYQDIITEAVKNNYCDDETETIIRTLIETVAERKSFLFQKFIRKIDSLKDKFKDFPVLMRLLLSIGRGYIRKKELISLNICPPKSLNAKLQKLQDSNLITILGNIYQINDELFSFWLTNIFYLYFYPAVFHNLRRQRILKENINENLSIFKRYFNEDKIKRISDFITSFRNDSIRLGRYRFKLPLIEKTKIIPFPERKLNFLIGEGKEIIFVGIKENAIEDRDIIEYLDKTSIFTNRNVKKIFISLGKFTSSAKFIGETNNLILWDGNTLNSLLRIYRKPIIINENTGGI